MDRRPAGGIRQRIHHYLAATDASRAMIVLYHGPVKRHDFLRIASRTSCPGLQENRKLKSSAAILDLCWALRYVAALEN